MNCRGFQHEIYEYLDGTLSPRAQAAAERHLTECAVCRDKLDQERQVAESLSDRFRRATDSVQLPAAVGRRVLAAVVEERRESDNPQGIVLFWRRLGLPLAMAAGVLLLAAGLFGFVRGLAPGGARRPPSPGGGGITVQASYIVPVYTFQNEGGLVIDALTYQTNVVNQRLQTELARLD